MYMYIVHVHVHVGTYRQAVLHLYQYMHLYRCHTCTCRYRQEVQGTKESKQIQILYRPRIETLQYYFIVEKSDKTLRIIFVELHVFPFFVVHVHVHVHVACISFILARATQQQCTNTYTCTCTHCTCMHACMYQKQRANTGIGNFQLPIHVISGI